MAIQAAAWGVNKHACSEGEGSIGPDQSFICEPCLGDSCLRFIRRRGDNTGERHNAAALTCELLRLALLQPEHVPAPYPEGPQPSRHHPPTKADYERGASEVFTRPARGVPAWRDRHLQHHVRKGRRGDKSPGKEVVPCKWSASLPGENTTASSHLAAAIAGVMQRECRLHSSPVVPCSTSRVCLLEPDDPDVEYGGL